MPSLIFSPVANFGQQSLLSSSFNPVYDLLDVSPPEDDDENVELVSEKSLECDECGKICKNQKHFTNHKRYHKSLNGPQEYCEKCDRNIPEKFFPSHCLSVHPGEYDEVRGRSLTTLTKMLPTYPSVG